MNATQGGGGGAGAGDNLLLRRVAAGRGSNLHVMVRIPLNSYYPVVLIVSSLPAGSQPAREAIPRLPDPQVQDQFAAVMETKTMAIIKPFSSPLPPSSFLST